MNISKSLAAALLIAASAPLLQSCFPAVATGVGATVLIVADRRLTETYLADQAVELRAIGRVNDRFGDRVHVNVTSYNRVVLLTGEAPDEASRAEIEQIAKAVPNVRSVVNDVQIAGASSFGARSNDTYITSKVKARFVDNGRFAANHVKVVTENNVVYLLGLVTGKEADAAVDIARTTGGVQKVVRVFEIISEAEARRLDNRPPEQAPPPQRS